MSQTNWKGENGSNQGDSGVLEKSIVLLHGNRSKDITVLEKGFNLHGMPDNYLTKRSRNENIIFHAAMSDALKSPFSGVGEFPSFPVPSLSYTTENQSEVNSTNQVDHGLPKDSITDQFHEQINDSCKSAGDTLIRAPVNRKTSTCDGIGGPVRVRSQSEGSSKRPWTINPDEYICMAKWQLQDLSLVVGSDLAIFGTPRHPCISLKLSPLHEPINVLTGVDIWLENMLNEVPEVAMCYHHEGIVMQEYKIYMTDELPDVAGFQSQQVYNALQNLLMFLKRNATQEGHTYWLVKEAGIDIVKLYDLTTLCANDSDPSTKEEDSDPFILPVASLCYRLAERRWSEYRVLCNRTIAESPARADRGVNLPADKIASLLSDALRLLSNCLNLISALEETTGQYCSTATPKMSSTASLWSRPRSRADIIDLKMRAVLLLCRLYLATPSHMIANCIRRIKENLTPRRGAMASMHVGELGKRPPQESKDRSSMSENMRSKLSCTAGEQEHPDSEHHLVSLKNSSQSQPRAGRLGSILIEAFQVPDSKKLSQLAVALLDTSTAFIPLEPSSSHLSPEEMNSLPESIWLHMLGSQVEERSSGQNLLLLPFVLLKSYLHKATHLWNYHRHSQNSKLEVDRSPLESLKVLCDIFRYTLPPILMLEHVAPDRFCSTCASDLSPTCPVCMASNTEQVAGDWPIDKDHLTELLGIASQLLSISVLNYSNKLRELAASADKMVSIDEIGTQQILTVEKSDLLLLRAGCPASMKRLGVFFKSTIPCLTEYAIHLRPPSTLTACITWLDIITYAIRSACRALDFNGLFDNGDRFSAKKTTTLAKRHKFRGTNPSDSLHVSSSWVPAFVNMYIIALRSLWLSAVTGAHKKVSEASLPWETINAKMDFSLRLVIGDLSDEFHSPDKDDYELLVHTNEFQLLKLVAAASQFEQSTSPVWTHHFGRLPKSYKPILPVQTLVWSSARPQSSTKSTKGRYKTTAGQSRLNGFSLTAVCLARTIDALLRHHLTPSEALQSEVHIHLLSNLLTTANEFLAVCVDVNNEKDERDSAFLSTVSQVLKQVTRYIPDEFVVTLSLQSSRQSLSMSHRHLATVLLDFRQSQMNIAIRQHRIDHMVSDYRSSSSTPPAWTTVINQARRAAVTWIEWNAWDLKQLATNACPGDGQLFKQLMIGISSLISLVNRLTTLQAINLSVLSVSGLLAILRDISLIQPVVSAADGQLQHFKQEGDTEKAPFICEAEGYLKQAIQSLFCNLISISQTLAKKLTNMHGETTCVGGKASRQKRKSAGHSVTSDKQEITSTAELINGLLGSPDGLRDVCPTSLDDFITTSANMGLDDITTLCHLVKGKIDYLSTHFLNR